MQYSTVDQPRLAQYSTDSGVQSPRLPYQQQQQQEAEYYSTEHLYSHIPDIVAPDPVT